MARPRKADLVDMTELAKDIRSPKDIEKQIEEVERTRLFAQTIADINRLKAIIPEKEKVTKTTNIDVPTAKYIEALAKYMSKPSGTILKMAIKKLLKREVDKAVKFLRATKDVPIN